MSLNPISPGGSGGGADPDLARDVADLETRAGLLEDRATELEARPAGKRDRWQLLGYQTLTVNGTWTKATFLAAHAAGYAADDIRLDIDIVGGGASGFATNNTSAGQSGGTAGGVKRLRMIHPDDLPATVPVVVGSGGAAVINPATTAATSISNPGGSSRFGDAVALGGRGGNMTYPHAIYLLPPTDMMSGIPGAGALWPAGPSYGPGAGGGGGTYNTDGGDGGDAGVDLLSSKTAGGIKGTTLTPGGDGASAAGAYGFGAGGGGGRGSVNGTLQAGGAGGFPGGGGGGGGRPQSDSSAAGQPSGGAGGNGCVRIRIFRRVS